MLVLALLAALGAGCLGSEDPSDGLEQAEANETDVPLGPTGLSEAVYDEIDHEVRNVTSSVDDTELRVDVYKPAPEGTYPTIVVLSPYWSFGNDAKDEDRNGGPPSVYVDYFAPRGYAVTLAEMRGTRQSGGCWDFGGELDQQDGHDVVEAIAEQPWSDGSVGMIGVSHVGMSQIATAITAPESLDTIVPIAAVSDWYRYLHKDGAPYVLNRATPPAYFAVHASPPTDPITDGRVTPGFALTQAEVACPDNVEHLSQSAELDGDKDAYWQERNLIAGADDITASVFLVHGFQDENVKTDHFLDFWQSLPEDVDRKAWFAQFGHEHPPYEEWRRDVHAWFDHELKGVDNGIDEDPTVTVQASNGTARTETDWPSAATETTNWTPSADGALVETNETAEAGDVRYLEVPGDDRDQPRTEALPRRVAFATEPLAEPLHLAGEAQLTVEATLDQPAARWAVLLLEVNGSQVDEITRGYLDAGHRGGNEDSQPVPVGEPVTYTVELFPRDHVVDAGNELRLVLVGGDMGCQRPGPDVGPLRSGTCEGTGIVPVERPVQHVVHVGPETPTRLHLPVVHDPGPTRDLIEIDGFLADPPP
jgi:X-Pro dipeptidyl-peptidase